ncbi:MAG: metal-dependent hydrolase [Euryarchaeota archaeon]
MRARTHILLTYLLTAPLLGPHHATLTALTTILPDLDHPNSLAASLLHPLELLTRTNLRHALARRLRHRGPLHCPWPWAALTYTLWTTGHPNAALIPLGALLHCLEDALTTMGIPVAWRRKDGEWRSVRLSLARIPSNRWDTALPPLALAVTWATLLLNPTELYELHPTPALERAYWHTRAALLRPFLHTPESLNQETLRVSKYDRLPRVRAILRYDPGEREVTGLWTPTGWVRGDDGRWYPPPNHGLRVLELSYPKARYRVTTTHDWPPTGGALALHALLTYERLTPEELERTARRAVLLGLAIRHTDRRTGRLVLEGRWITGAALAHLPRPAWARLSLLTTRA